MGTYQHGRCRWAEVKHPLQRPYLGHQYWLRRLGWDIPRPRMQVVGAIRTLKVDEDAAELYVTSITETLDFESREGTNITVE